MELAPYAPGRVARLLLGRHFDPLGRAYRRVFVDLNKIAAAFDAAIPPNESVLDVGGGDGSLIDRLLCRRPDLTITICDEAPDIGSLLSAANRRSVRMLPATDFSNVTGHFGVVTISDVMHHVRPAQRNDFIAALAEGCRRWGCRKIIVKDIEPGNWRAALSWFADRYVSGDRQVALISQADLKNAMQSYFPESTITHSMPDAPNYCSVVSLAPSVEADL